MTNKKKKMLLVGGAYSYYRPFEFMYTQTSNYLEFLSNPNTFDLVLFTGGEDVSTHLYGEFAAPGMVHNNVDRDESESRIFNIAKKHGVKMAGICRGVQFLNVMHGGSLLHDITNHANFNGGHTMLTHNGYPIHTNSLHHQACLPPKNSYVIGWVENGNTLEVRGNLGVKLNWYPKIIVEALIFKDTMSYGVQYHPEMMDEGSAAYIWFQELIGDMASIKEKNKILKKWTHLKKLGELNALSIEETIEAAYGYIY